MESGLKNPKPEKGGHSKVKAEKDIKAGRGETSRKVKVEVDVKKSETDVKGLHGTHVKRETEAISVKRTVVTKKERKVYDLLGQKHEPLPERDPLRIFYETLHEQRPDSEMALIWMMEYGLLEPAMAERALAIKQRKSGGGAISKSPAGKMSNGSGAKRGPAPKGVAAQKEAAKKPAAPTKVAAKESGKGRAAAIKGQAAARKRAAAAKSDDDDDSDDDRPLQQKAKAMAKRSPGGGGRAAAKSKEDFDGSDSEGEVIPMKKVRR